jgi:hypothetical protein
MKKIGALVVTIVMAQLLFAQNVQFGLKGGVNISSANDEDLVSDDKVTPVVGYHFGGLAHIHLSPNWALQPEVVYSKEGARVEHPTYNATTELKYINIPVLAQYMVGNGFRIQTGPQVGLLVSNKFETPDGIEGDKYDASKANLSWAFGVGYLTNSGFGVDARFNLGLTNQYKEGVYNGAESKGRVGQIGIFYQFRQ